MRKSFTVLKSYEYYMKNEKQKSMMNKWYEFFNTSPQPLKWIEMYIY